MAQKDSVLFINSIIATCKDLADEKLKCANMMHLLELSAGNIEDPDMNVNEGVLITILAKYWQWRLEIISAIMPLIKELDVQNEDIERFIRHNT